jgi:hypothetical protein
MLGYQGYPLSKLGDLPEFDSFDPVQRKGITTAAH